MYERYGLTKNPFVSDTPLDVPPDTLDQFLIVDGFGEQKALIDEAAKAERARVQNLAKAAETASSDQAKSKRSQFVLIHGNSGTGRTSVSNYITHVFSEGRTPMKVTEPISDSAHKESFHNWMENFSLKAYLDGFVKVPGLFEKVGDLSSATPAKYVKFLHEALSELQTKPRRVIALFEDVKNAELFPLVQSVFDPINFQLPDPPLVIFTTSNAAISDAFTNLKPTPEGPGRIILRETDGQDVLEFLSQKWAVATKFQPHPFDHVTVVQAFSSQRYPLKRAIEALNYILDEKLKKSQTATYWPDDNSLAINGLEIAMSLLEFGKRAP